MVYSRKVLVFIDLDDTLFQTKRKNPSASILATKTADVQTASYMSESQSHLLELFKNSSDCGLVPVTARDKDQYERTFISKESSVIAASICFGSKILINNTDDQNWDRIISTIIEENPVPVHILEKTIRDLLDDRIYRIINVSGYYLSVKCLDRNNYSDKIEECRQLLQSKLPIDYRIYSNANNIALVPSGIDKANSVRYLVDAFKPVLIIGVGDSFSDWSFMDICHFKVLPKDSQLDRYFASSLIDFNAKS
jgi:hydroxymethylpyrimidine pyrophosphatase-like HAD family hydrolase